MKSNEDERAGIRQRRCLEDLTRGALVEIVEGMLTVMYPPGDIERQWSPDTMEELVRALGPNLVDAWVDEVEDETERPKRLAVEATSIVDLADRGALHRWTDDMRVALADAESVVRDALRPLGQRELGRVLHRERQAVAHAKALALLAKLEEVIR